MKFFIKENGIDKEIEADTLNIQSGDTIIIKMPFQDYDYDSVKEMKDRVSEIFSKNYVLVVNTDIEFGVVKNT